MPPDLFLLFLPHVFSNPNFNLDGLEQDAITNMLQDTLVEEQVTSAALTALTALTASPESSLKTKATVSLDPGLNSSQ